MAFVTPARQERKLTLPMTGFWSGWSGRRLGRASASGRHARRRRLFGSLRNNLPPNSTARRRRQRRGSPERRICERRRWRAAARRSTGERSFAPAGGCALRRPGADPEGRRKPPGKAGRIARGSTFFTLLPARNPNVRRARREHEHGPSRRLLRLLWQAWRSRFVGTGAFASLRNVRAKESMDPDAALILRIREVHRWLRTPVHRLEATADELLTKHRHEHRGLFVFADFAGKK